MKIEIDSSGPLFLLVHDDDVKMMLHDDDLHAAERPVIYGGLDDDDCNCTRNFSSRNIIVYIVYYISQCTPLEPFSGRPQLHSIRGSRIRQFSLP
jgi:hypothetical protein